MNESISIIDSVELIPLESAEVNPYLTKVRIKVFHLGENRNHSYIDKNTAVSMAKTLRGNPIVARYREEKGDFTDHGEEITLNDQGFKKEIKTKPYGFVDLNAQIWFEDFNDTDENGQIVRHTYLVTEGMIWSEYYQELQNTILQGGRPQSMELDEKTLNGTWSNSINSNYEIFIINDAIITKLCALGEDVEPCFLGASITPIFTEQYKNENFVKELLDFKTKFNLALKNDKGGTQMEETTQVVDSVEKNVVPEEVTKNTENFEEPQDKNDLEDISENQITTEEFAKKDDEEDNSDDSESEAEDKKEDSAEEEEDKKKYELLEEKFSLLEKEYNELKENYSTLQKENEELIQFKNHAEDEKKTELINSFYMLSDEDKKEVIENKSKFTLDEIEAKLSVICVRKKVNFNLEENEEEQPSVTFNLAPEIDDTPAWLKAVDNRRKDNI